MATKLIKSSTTVLDPNIVINGFCPAFCRLLVDKLKELKRSGKLLGKTRNMTPIASTVFVHLVRQLGFLASCYLENGPDDMRHTLVDGIIKTAEEFLAIFEEKPKKRKVEFDFGGKEPGRTQVTELKTPPKPTPPQI